MASNDTHNLTSRIANLSNTQKQKLAQKLGLSNKHADTKLIACITSVDNQPVTRDELQSHVANRLPKYAVPQEWKQVTQLPRTPAGKLQRKGLEQVDWQLLKIPEPAQDDDFFDLFDDDEYVAPRNETESLLAQIWCDVLGIDKVSIHDEFLEVGGDSLLSIRILARINKAGLNIATEDFFDYPTIAGQAQAMMKTDEKQYDAGRTTGEFSLIPIQSWLFDRIQVDPQHWNQSLLLNVDEALSFLALDRTVQHLFAHHDALRLAFDSNERTGVAAATISSQHYEPLGSQLPVASIDLTDKSSTERLAFIENYANQQNKTLNLSGGQLVSITFFKTPSKEPNQLLLIINHLIIDAESWRILIEDLSVSWASFNRGTKPSLPEKTSSFQLWSENLADYAQSTDLLAQLPYWCKQTSQTRLPVDFANAAKQPTAASTEVLTLHFDEQQTAALKASSANAQTGGIKSYLLCALTLSLLHWTQRESLVIDIEGHGREDLFDNADVSRTLGWFTTVYPVRFKIGRHSALIDALQEVSRTLDAVPQNGVGHGLLRYINQVPELCNMENSQVCFNYLGEVDKGSGPSGDVLVEPVEANIGEPRSPRGLRAFALEINAKITQNQLQIDWSYSRDLHQLSTIESLAETCKGLLLELGQTQVAESAVDDDDLFALDDFAENELDALSQALSQTNQSSQDR